MDFKSMTVIFLRLKNFAFRLRVLLPFLLLAGLLFGPTLIQQKALFWGTPSLQFIPWWKLSWDAILSKQLPLWNPYLGMGAPLLANYQSALFYPPHWVYFILYVLGGVAWMAWGMALMVAFHLILACLGMYLLVRKIGGSSVAGIISGIAFGFSGYLVARAGFLSINATVAWLPWLLWCFTPDLKMRTIHASINAKIPENPYSTVFIITMQLLAGHAQLAWYSLVLCFLWVGFWSIRVSQQERGILTKGSAQKTKLFSILRPVVSNIGRFCTILLFAVALSAIQLLPTAEYLLLSQRGDAVDFQLAMTYSFWPWHLLTLLAPETFGSPVYGDYWGYANFWEDAIYIGIFPLVLAVFAAVRAVKAVISKSEKGGDGTGRAVIIPRLVLFLLILILCAIVLAMGKNTPLFPWLYRNIPTFDLFQAPTRYMIWFVFAITFMAGLGVDWLKRPTGKALYWTRLATAGAFSISLGALFTQIALPEVQPTFIRSALKAGLLSLFTGLLILFAPQKEGESKIRFRVAIIRYRLLWSVIVLGLIVADLYLAGRGLLPDVNKDFYLPVSQRYGEQLDDGNKRIYMPADVENKLKFNKFFRFNTFYAVDDWNELRYSFLPNLTVLDSVYSVNNFDPILPNLYTSWLSAYEKIDPQRKAKWLQWMNVYKLIEFDDSKTLHISEKAVPGSKNIWFYECGIIVRTPDEALGLLENDSSIDRVVLLDNKEIAHSHVGACSPEESEVSVNSVTNGYNKIALKVDTPNSGWLVLSESWFPGWHARVDGRETVLYQANYLFRAVYLQEGKHDVLFYYQPLWFWVGVGISVVSLFLYISLVLRFIVTQRDAKL